MDQKKKKLMQSLFDTINTENDSSFPRQQEQRETSDSLKEKLVVPPKPLKYHFFLSLVSLGILNILFAFILYQAIDAHFYYKQTTSYSKFSKTLWHQEKTQRPLMFQDLRKILKNSKMDSTKVEYLLGKPDLLIDLRDPYQKIKITLKSPQSPFPKDFIYQTTYPNPSVIYAYYDPKKDWQFYIRFNAENTIYDTKYDFNPKRFF